MNEWRTPLIADTNYIMDEALKNCWKIILVTYETANGQRYVRQVECYHGRVMKKVGGRVIAWMPLPEPFK